MIADVIVDLQYGDCGKGKITHHLLEKNHYTHCIRYNGGCNAGHTIYHNGKKFVTHHIPAGVFYGVKSIIGPGCVVSVEQFFKELEELRSGGLDISKDMIRIAHNTHVITDAHRAEDSKDVAIGTTKQGNGPAYRDKYARKGIRAGSVPKLQDYLVDLYEELHESKEVFSKPKVLLEGAQGIGLDIDWGDYPYVTSSHCTVGGALLNGIPYSAVRTVHGVAKPYETYVGTKRFEVPVDAEDEALFHTIRDLGGEYGATTGRPRQVNWMDIDMLIKGININGVTDLVLNKMDVLKKVNVWKYYSKGSLFSLDSEEKFKRLIRSSIPKDVDIYFSYCPEKV